MCPIRRELDCGHVAKSLARTTVSTAASTDRSLAVNQQALVLNKAYSHLANPSLPPNNRLEGAGICAPYAPGASHG